MAFGRFSTGEGLPTKKFHIEPPARYREWDPVDFDALKAKVKPGTVWKYAESSTGEKKEVVVLDVRGSNVSFTYKAILDRNEVKPEGERLSREELLAGRTYVHTLYDFLEYADLDESVQLESEEIKSSVSEYITTTPRKERTEHQVRDAQILEEVRIRTIERLAAQEAALAERNRGMFGSLRSWLGRKLAKPEMRTTLNSVEPEPKPSRKRFLAGLGIGAAVASLFSSADNRSVEHQPARTEAAQPQKESEKARTYESIVPGVEGRLERGDGANELLIELRQSLLEQYGEELHDVRPSVLRFLQRSMNYWSHEFGFVTGEGSVLVHPGATLSFNESGELVFADKVQGREIALMDAHGTLNSGGIELIKSMQHLPTSQ